MSKYIISCVCFFSRCILAASCHDHSLRLYMSSKFKNTWTEIVSVSQQWNQHCQREYLPDVEEKLSSLKTVKENQKRRSMEKISLRCSMELGYINKVCLECFAWYPSLINIKSSLPDHTTTYAALLVAVTLSGQLTFWQIGVPVLSEKAKVVLIDGDIKCSISQACSLAWLSTDTNKGEPLIGVPAI